MRLGAGALAATLLLLASATAAAQPVTTVDAGFVAASPAALQTGLSTGVGLGFTYGCWNALGVRASWSTATESTLAWEVRHDDLRLRVGGGLQHVIGRGTLSLRLGVGGTVVHEDRTRSQGNRAGLSGSLLETTSWAVLPAADLEAVVLLHVLGPWSVSVAGGPSAHWVEHELRIGWTTAVGVGWDP